MKTIKITIALIFLSVFFSNAQPFAGPGISWKRSDRLDAYPAFAIHPTYQKIDETTEDWWYDHKNSYDNGVISDANFNGFITCGYSLFRNVYFSEINHGCYGFGLSSITHLCSDDIDFPSFEANDVEAGVQTIARYDSYGRLIFYNSYNTSGWFIRIIQTSDGNYVAVGPTVSTRESDLTTPLYYNPRGTGPFDSFGITIPCPTSLTPKVNVVKIDPHGYVIWNYLYGIKDAGETDCAVDNYKPWDLVEYNEAGSPKIRIVGECKLASNSYTSAFMIDINSSDGTFNWGRDYAPVNTSAGDKRFYAIEKNIVPGGDEYLATIGSENDHSSGSVTWLQARYDDVTTATNVWDQSYGSASTSTLNTTADDLCFAPASGPLHGDLLVPVMYNCNNCTEDELDTHSEAAVYELDVSSGNYVNQFQITDGTTAPDSVHAYDLKIGITNTHDGGFAIATTKIPIAFHDEYSDVTWTCGYTYTTDPTATTGVIIRHWNADGFVRKFDQNGNIEWSKSWDIDQNDPAPYPHDQKRSECLYSISETPDHGLVVAGNDSRNFDDTYLVKLYDNCTNEQTYDYNPESGVIELADLGTSPSVTISSSLKIRGSLVIHSGESLQIQGSSTVIEFADTRKCGIPTNIVVEPGGSLTITDGALLTSIQDCGLSMWDGVQLWGDNTVTTQSSSNEPSVEISGGATIQNARYGILADRTYYATHEHWLTSNQDVIKDLAMEEPQTNGGGIITADDAYFKNCRFSIVMDSYDHPNTSIIHNSHFILDDQIHDFDAVDASDIRTGINAFVKLFDVHSAHGIIFDNNEYSVSSTVKSILPTAEWGTGFGAFESEYQITNSNFTNLEYGLNTGASNTANSFTANCNTMTDVVHGAEINNIWGFIMMNNNIGVTDQGTDQQYGVYMESCTGFQIENNAITYASSTWYTNPVGLTDFFNTSNSNYNEIKNNQFTNFQHATILEGQQLKSSNTSQGLKIYCNDYSNYEHAISVTLPPGIAGVQDGPSTTVGANNSFSSTSCSVSEGELLNPSTMNPFDYYHKLNSGTDYVQPGSSCFTSGQVTPVPIPTTFNRTNDCPITISDCTPLMVIHTTNSTIQPEVQRSRSNVTNANISMNDSQFNEKVRSFLHDNIPDPMDSIIDLILNSHISGQDYLLACAYAKKGDKTDLTGILNHLSADTIYSSFAQVMNLIDSEDYSRLRKDTAIKSILIDLAKDTTKYGYAAIRNILQNVYGEHYPEVIILPSANISERRSNKVENKNTLVYPNPFTSSLTIDLTGSNDLYRLKLYNILGNVVKDIVVKGNQFFILNSEDLPTGLFLLNISRNEKQIFSQKLNHISN